MGKKVGVNKKLSKKFKKIVGKKVVWKKVGKKIKVVEKKVRLKKKVGVKKKSRQKVEKKILCNYYYGITMVYVHPKFVFGCGEK